jgi:uncharacterized protein YjbI with pentapeptide repeats
MARTRTNLQGSQTKLGDPSQVNIYNIAQGNVSGVPFNRKNQEGNSEAQVLLDHEVVNLLKWLSSEKRISFEAALRKAVLTEAYFHDVITKQGGKLYIQNKDKSISEVILK